MNKKMLAIGITLLIVGMMIVPVSAIVTQPTTIKDALLKGIWTAILDLQKQITALTKKVDTIQSTPGPAGPQGPAGATVHYGAWQNIPVNAQDGYYTTTAATDGTVTVLCYTPNAPVRVAGFISFGGSGPLDLVAYSYSPMEISTIGNIGKTSITMPVRKGDRWEIAWDKCEYNLWIRWLPLSA